MMTVSAVEFQKTFGRYQDETFSQPRAIMPDDGDCLVVLSVEEYQQLKRRDRVAFKTEELTDDEVRTITSSRMDPRHDYLNAELGQGSA